MRDTEFKNFNHRLPEGSLILSTGQNLIDGYRPDISIQNSDGDVHVILESERKSERKAFIGAMVKASHFAYDTKIPVTLIFIMKETGNQTTIGQVSANIRPHFEWLVKLGAKQLQRIIFISDNAYIASANNDEAILSAAFISRCVVLES